MDYLYKPYKTWTGIAINTAIGGEDFETLTFSDDSSSVRLSFGNKRIIMNNLDNGVLTYIELTSRQRQLLMIGLFKI